MNIPVDGLFYIFLLVIGGISFVGGFLAMKQSNQTSIGFMSVFAVSVILFVLVLRWFKSAAIDVYMGTIPWLFNQAFAIILYIVFLVFTLLIFMRMNKKLN